MPATQLQIGNKFESIRPGQVYGQLSLPESSLVNPYQGCTIASLSGGTNSLISALSPDITYNQTSNVTLIPDSYVPTAPSMRLRPRKIDIAVHGNVSWAGGTAIIIQDGAGYPFAYVPLAAITAYAQFSLPFSGTATFPNAKTVASYDSTTGVITFAAATWTASSLVGFPFTVIAGTGRGQTGIVSANAATTITPTTILGTALDSTSVVAVHYHTATSGGATSITDTKAGYTAHQFQDGGWSVVILAGTGAGQVRDISDNDTTALTVAAWTTNPDNTSVFVITRMPQLMGVVDLSVGQHFPTAAVGKGIAAALLGTFTGTTSSPVRVAVEADVTF